MEVTIRTHNEQKEQSMRKDDGAGSEGLAEEDRVGGLRQEADGAEHGSAQARATLGLCLGRSGCCVEYATSSLAGVTGRWQAAPPGSVALQL